MKIAIASDHGGYALKNELLPYITELGHEFRDFGCCSTDSMDYPDIAFPAAEAVASGEFDRGILICGTGIGMAISANKVNGVYAAVCHDIYSTERSILSNDCNCMCMGALVIGKATALTLVRTWLSLTFKESPSSKKIAKFKQIEAGTMEVKLHAN